MSHRLQTAARHIINFFCLFSTAAVFAAPGNFYLGGALHDSVGRLDNSNPSIAYFSGITVTDDYPPNHTTHSSMLLSINGGYEFAGAKWQPATAFGLGIYRTINDYNVSGQLIESAPDNTNTLYNYNYNIKQWIAMAEMKLTWKVWQFAPFINGGIGPAWNELTNYHETPVFATGFVVFPPFQARTTVNFAYQVGLGVGYEFNFNGDNSGFKHERVSLGYQYMNFGTSSFGIRGPDYPYNLNPGRLSANDFYLSFVHLF